VGEWQTRAQVSVLLLPNTGARQLLHEEGLLVGAADEVMTADRACLPYFLDALQAGSRRRASPPPS
jgi:hypothetical protein